MSIRIVQRPRTLRVLVFPVGVTAFASRTLMCGEAHKRYERPVLFKVKKGRAVGLTLCSGRIEEGVNCAMTTCPRCGQMLVDRGYEYYCQYGCTRSFPKVGALWSDRYEHERKSGMVTLRHELDGEMGLQQGLRHRTELQKRRQSEYMKRYAARKKRQRRRLALA